MGAGAKIWLYDKDAAVWRPAYCDSDGKIRISDEDPFELIQDTPEDLKHLPHGYYAAGPTYKPFAVDTNGLLQLHIDALDHLNDIADVNIPSPTDGYFVYWDAAAGKFQVKAVAGTKIQDADADTKIDVEESADEDKIRMDVKGVEAFLLDDAGILTLAKQSAFSVYQTTDQTIGSLSTTTINWDTAVFDIQSEFNLANEKFIPKVAGLYLFTAHMQFYDIDDGNYMALYLYVGAATPAFSQTFSSKANLALTCSFLYIAQLSALDEVQLRIRHNNGVNVDTYARQFATWFTGIKIA